MIAHQSTLGKVFLSLPRLNAFAPSQKNITASNQMATVHGVVFDIFSWGGRPEALIDGANTVAPRGVADVV
jgi:hypothetical protein